MIKSKREEEEKTFALFLSLNYFERERETRHIISQIGITPHASSSPLRFRPNFDTRKETTTAFTPTGDDDDDDDDDESTTGVVALEDATG